MLSNEHTNVLFHLIALQKLNSTGKGTACIPELHTERFSQCIQSSLAPDLVIWGQDDHLQVNLELDLELDIHTFCSEVTCMLIAQCVSGLPHFFRGAYNSN